MRFLAPTVPGVGTQKRSMVRGAFGRESLKICLKHGQTSRVQVQLVSVINHDKSLLNQRGLSVLRNSRKIPKQD